VRKVIFHDLPSHLAEAIVTRDKVDETPLYLSRIRMSSV
jgi:hypothetical protein